jgi:GDP-L-fucose synthase
MKVLVTGAYGLVGKSLQKVVGLSVDNQNGNEYIYLSRRDCDLRNNKMVLECFSFHKPDVVIHLASKVGGVYDNLNGNYTFLMDNIKINMNIVEACEKTNVKRLINILSTCIFPDKNIKYPLTSDQLHNGLPHDSNIGYAYSKRVLHLASHLLSKKENIQVINITPTNLYGDYDNYNLQSSHVIPGLIHKTYLAQNNNTALTVFGSGKAMRQFLYVDDLSKIILEFVKLELSEKEVSIIASPPESDETSIKRLIQMICDIYNFSGDIIYDMSYQDGQFKKTTNDDELNKFLPNFKFTPLRVGLENTIKFFKNNYDNLRT